MSGAGHTGNVLLIDAGNTRIKWAVAATADVRAPSWHAATPGYRAQGALGHADWKQLGEQLAPHFDAPPRGVWLSNVAGAPALQAVQLTLQTCWGAASPPLHALSAPARQLGVSNPYTEPARLGSDRWASLIAAHAAWPGEALLIVTLGTATTLDSLDADGHFLGGLIAPGPDLMLESLAVGTAQLPNVTLADAHAAPFATDTRSAIASGCAAAQAGLIERTHAALARHLGAPVRCVLTGGARERLATHLSIPVTAHDNLVLAGLHEIARDALACPAPEALP